MSKYTRYDNYSDLQSLRILVVEDDVFNSAGICAYLREHGMEVDSAGTLQEAIQKTQAWMPHVVVLDIVIPEHNGANVDLEKANGIEVARRIKDFSPEIGIVLFSNYPYFRPEVLELVREKEGGLAYLFKGGTTPSELRNVIRQVFDGGIIFGPQVNQDKRNRHNLETLSLTEKEQLIIEYAITQVNILTRREWEIFYQVASAKTNAGIAQSLGISTNAVQTHLQNIYSKLGFSEVDRLFNQRSLLSKTYFIYRNMSK